MKESKNPFLYAYDDELIEVISQPANTYEILLRGNYRKYWPGSDYVDGWVVIPVPKKLSLWQRLKRMVKAK